jgi:type II secretory pathway predicted ATPase ExeA
MKMNTKMQTEILSFYNISKLPFIERSKLSYRYDELESNMSMLSSVFYSRQIAAITGASGTGKSSLIFYGF